MSNRSDNHPEKPSLCQEFYSSIRATPRIWLLVLIAALILTSPLQGIVGGLLIWSAMAAVVIAALFLLPAFIGAIAGHAAGRTLRWCKQLVGRR